MIRRSPLLLACALAAGACGALTGLDRATYHEPIWLHEDESILLPEGTATFTFLSVEEDSRCPSDPRVDCIWAGRVRIRVAVGPSGGGTTIHELRFLDEPSQLVVGNATVGLIGVAPEATLGDPIFRYRVRVVIAPGAG